MPEKNNSSSNMQKENTSKEDQDQQARLAVRLALIEHGSRPLAILLIGVGILLWLTWVRDPLFEVLNRTQGVKFGSFELRIQEEADAQNLGQALQNLRELTADQLALFLVIGRDRGQGIRYNGPEVTEENLQALLEAGLIDNFQKRAEPDIGFQWRVSDEANRLYAIIYLNIESAIRLAAAPTVTP